MAAFEFMVYRLTNTPLSAENFQKEKKYILDTAKLNGYDASKIQSIISKHQWRKDLKQLTTLSRIKKEPLKVVNGERTLSVFTELPFVPPLSNKIEKILNKHGMTSYYTSQGNLKDIIGPLKDKLSKDEKSGIYEISCNGYEATYIGQTKRRLKTRHNEHKAALAAGNTLGSAMAKHCVATRHEIGQANIIKKVRDSRQLDAWESLFILRGEKLVNIEGPPISFSPLLSTKTNP
jgi:GIY-YIG catalytic domain